MLPIPLILVCYKGRYVTYLSRSLINKAHILSRRNEDLKHTVSKANNHTNNLKLIACKLSFQLEQFAVHKTGSSETYDKLRVF